MLKRKRNPDGFAEHSIVDHPFLTEIGDKPHFFKVLKFIGPWLSWQDWRYVEKLDKATHKWCHSDDVAISLFGLWQERSKSLFEIIQQLWDLSSLSGLTPDSCFDNNQIPFLGSFYNLVLFPRGAGNGSVLYRSSLELSDLEEKIVEHGAHKGTSCVRNDPLPIRKDDQWLLISDSHDHLKTDCIPPYYFLKIAVPKGLKIVLSIPYIGGSRYWTAETFAAVGRAVALGATSLIVYEYGANDFVKLLYPFFSKLKEQKKGEFVALESLSLHSSVTSYEGKPRKELSNGMVSLALHTLRSLKYLRLAFAKRQSLAEGFVLRSLPYTCPELKVLELGEHSEGISG